MLKRKKLLFLTTLIMLLPMVAGLLLWNRLPAEIPTHWNAQGVVDGWSSKAFAVFGLPGIVLAIHWLCVLGTLADPKEKNHARQLQTLVLWICPVLSVVLMAATYGTALGLQLPVEVLVTCLVGVLFVIIGNYMPKCKQNYTMGIKLPWTLNSEENWNATHRFAGYLWLMGGLVLIPLALLVPKAAVWVLLPLMLVLVLAPMIYSYVYFRRHDRK